MTEVFLHIYDVTSSSSATTNKAVLHLNKLLRGGFRLGGVFHSAVEVYDCEEWSFGFSRSGSGVFSCPHKEDLSYSYRETLSLGQTSLSRLKVTQILFELGREWSGDSYDVLSRNCNHFCDAFCERLGVQRLPAWVNCFARVGVAAAEAREAAIKPLREARNGIASASKKLHHFLVRLNSSSAVSPDPGAHARLVSSRRTGSAVRRTFLKAPSVCSSRLFASANRFGSSEKKSNGKGLC